MHSPEHDNVLPPDKMEEDGLLALFRLLLRQPPAGYDPKTYPICKRYGLTECRGRPRAGFNNGIASGFPFSWK